MKVCRAGIEFHEYDSVPVLIIALFAPSKRALTFHFLIPIIRKYIRKKSTYIKKKNIDGDSRS
jgi:hypothetical protein